MKFYEKAVFITSPQMPQDYRKLCSNDFGSVKASYRGIESEWHYEGDQFVWRCVIPDGSARVEFPLLQSQKTVEINDIVFKAHELGGEIIDGKMVFQLSAGEYIVK